MNVGTVFIVGEDLRVVYALVDEEIHVVQVPRKQLAAWVTTMPSERRPHSLVIKVWDSTAVGVWLETKPQEARDARRYVFGEITLSIMPATPVVAPA